MTHLRKRLATCFLGYAVDDRKAESIGHQAESRVEYGLGSMGRETIRKRNVQAAGHGFSVRRRVYTCMFRIMSHVRFRIFAAHPGTGIVARVTSCTESGTGKASCLATMILPAAYGAVAIRGAPTGTTTGRRQVQESMGPVSYAYTAPILYS